MRLKWESSCKSFAVLLSAALISGCATSGISPSTTDFSQLPENWRSDLDSSTVASGWFERYVHPELKGSVAKALKQNFSLQETYQRVEFAKQQAIISGADLWPQIDAGLNASRNRSTDPTNYNTSVSLGADISWEADLWGKLSDAERSASLSYASVEAEYQAARLSLVATVSKSWFDVQESALLRTQFEQRVSNLQNNLDIIESGYISGINESLDVYLARSDLATEKARLNGQVEVLASRVRTLQVLLGEYPSGEMDLEQHFPLVTDTTPAGLPSDLLTRRYDIQAAYLSLQAADADLAVAHKNRFPSLRLTGSVGRSSDELSDVLSGGSLAWNIAGGLTQPLFDAGRLEAREAQAMANLKVIEQQYLATIYDAFNEVETTLSTEQSLQRQYNLLVMTRENAEAAEALSFEEYRRGLVSYSSVLDSQRRAFDSQSAVIEVQNQLLRNRINLHLALGGDFQPQETSDNG